MVPASSLWPGARGHLPVPSSACLWERGSPGPLWGWCPRQSGKAVDSDAMGVSRLQFGQTRPCPIIRPAVRVTVGSGFFRSPHAQWPPVASQPHPVVGFLLSRRTVCKHLGICWEPCTPHWVRNPGALRLCLVLLAPACMNPDLPTVQWAGAPGSACWLLAWWLRVFLTHGAVSEARAGPRSSFRP